MESFVDEYSKGFLEETIGVWQPYSSTPLSKEDAREIATSMVELFTFLKQLEGKYPDVDVKKPLT